MPSNADNPSDPNGGRPHRRRPRYRGTHPRQFQERYKELDAEAYPEMQEHVRAQGRTPAGAHVPVMLAEVLAVLAPQPGAVVADCTLGYGGHARALLERVGPEGLLVGLDVDAEQLARTRDRLSGAGHDNVHLHHSNFAGLAKVLGLEGLAGADAVFADLGVSSMQIDDPRRGLSYKHDGPLDMRLDARIPLSAADWLARLSEAELAETLADLADEPHAQAIAAAIVRRRQQGPITRTGELVDTIFAALGLDRRRWRQQAQAKTHPAALTFQALRILVNDELGSLRQLLRIAPDCLAPGGRIAILSFHSGEDRLVKRAFREGLRAGLYAEAPDEVQRPTPQELADNPRSRSAKLRWARRM